MRRLTLIALLLCAIGLSAHAQADLPPAPITNDEGGPITITGTLTYTNLRFTSGVAQPILLLEDQTGFVDRNRYYLMPAESQVLGQYTSDFYSSPVDYTLSLPQVPRGGQRDVDFDGIDEPGVQVFAVAYWENTFGDPYMEERDLYGGGWSGAYASTRISEDPALEWEVIGGMLVVYAPDDQQGFPSGFGDDGKLFTEDDPLVRLPAGYTVVDLDASPFRFDRSREPVIDLIEPEGAALVDYTDYGLVEGFDAFTEKLRNEYAFTEYKGLDWDALIDEFRPRFAQAERNRSVEQYLLALRDFNWAIPDGHVAFGAQYYLSDQFQMETEGGLGLAVRELDDGRALVTTITPGSPAADAGIALRAEIIAIDGVPIAEAAAQIQPWTGPFSSDHVRRLEQFRFVTRSPIGTKVSVTYLNPGDAEPTTANLVSVLEPESLQVAETVIRQQTTGLELPVEYRLLDDGLVYARINSFSDNTLLTVQLWERLMQNLNETGASGLIIDMRENLGGSGFLADQLAAYLFDEALELGQNANYDRFSGEFYSDPRGIDRFYLPEPNKRFLGDMAVLVGPNCNSACEFFAYDLTLQDRATIVGQYPTAGLGGSISEVLMPLGIYFQFTAGRAQNIDGEIHIEGRGVGPTVRVPVTEETVFSTGDPVLEAAIRALTGGA